jgi:hypothetical protein
LRLVGNIVKQLRGDINIRMERVVAELLEYKFIDTAALDSYIEQFSSTEVEARSRTSKLAVSLAGPSADYSTASRFRTKTSTEKIKELVEYLSETKLLGRARPELMRSLQTAQKKAPPFFLERTAARKVILPTTLLDDASGIRQLAVWVSDPDPELIVPEKSGWDFPGSFLYLTEAHLDGGRLETVYSGCSALQAVANATQSRPLLGRSCTPDEPLGRDNYSHPIDKLTALGGIVGDTREIQCLYRMRYMTNEQCFSKDGVEYRVNDILGYPIYIAEILKEQR